MHRGLVACCRQQTFYTLGIHKVIRAQIIDVSNRTPDTRFMFQSLPSQQNLLLFNVYVCVWYNVYFVEES